VCIVPLAGRDVVINRQQFYQALCDALTARIMTDADAEISSKLHVLLPNSWPADMPPEYGEHEITEICTKFRCQYTSSLKAEYRDFKESAGSVVGRKVARLQCNVATLPISTAVCERGFSKMNIVCSPLRSKLTIKHMSSLLFISCVRPPLTTWQPHEYVRSWLAKGRRDADDSRCPRRKQGDPTDDQSMKQIWHLL